MAGCSEACGESVPAAATSPEPRPLCGPWARAVHGGECEQRAWQPLDKPLEGQLARLRVAVAADGDAVAAWVAGGSVYAGDERHEGWDRAALSARLDGMPESVTVTAGGDGWVAAGWVQRGETPAAVFASSRVRGGQWRVPEPVDRISFSSGASQLALAAGRGGDAVLTWNDGDRLQLFGATRDPNQAQLRSPSSDAVLCPRGVFTNKPEVAVNAGGDALIVWFQSLDAELRVWASERSGAHGTFSVPTPNDAISAGREGPELGPYYTDNPQPALHDSGRAAVVWEEPYGAMTTVALATRESHGAWTKPSSADDTLAVQAGVAREPRAVFSTGGGLFIVWWHQDGEGRSVRLAQGDAGGGWIHPGRQSLQLSSPGRWATEARIVASRDGSVVAAWLERDGRGRMQVVSRRTHDAWKGEWDAPATLGGGGEGENLYSLSLAVGGTRQRVLAGWLASGVAQFAAVD